MNKTVIILAGLAVALTVLLGTTAVLYTDTSQRLTDLTQERSNSAFYHDTLDKIRNDNQNATFAPPVSMEDALEVAFESNDWTADRLMELNATRVDIKMVYGYVDEASNETVVLGVVPSVQADYSHFSAEGVTQRYMWQIAAYDATSSLMPLTHDGYCLIDASTAEVINIPPS